MISKACIGSCKLQELLYSDNLRHLLSFASKCFRLGEVQWPLGLVVYRTLREIERELLRSSSLGKGNAPIRLVEVLSYSEGLMKASLSGMGALPFAGGASFRVWAPFATNVCVAGSFNGWSMTANPLTQEGNGYWSTDVAGAKVNDQYKFVLTSPLQRQTIVEE